MKKINIFLASSEELELERDKFSTLVLELNDLFERRGIRIKLKRWEDLDASMGPQQKQKEYNQILCHCEMTLVLFWRRFGDFTQSEFETAYEELKAERNPQKIYVFFKDAPPEELQDEFKSFKFSFDSKYGHFYGKFSNVDTMRLQFLLQLELYLNQSEPLLTVKEGYVKIDDTKLVELGNVPFAELNKDYQHLHLKIAKLKEEIAKDELECKENPQNQAKQSQLLQKQMELEEAQKEREQHEQHLFDTAKKVAELSSQYCNQLTLQAMTLLNEGKVSEAIAVLDMKNLNGDTEHNLKNYYRTLTEAKSWRQNIEADIQAFLLRAQSLQADLSIPGDDRYLAVCEAYNKALQIAREINYSPEMLVGEILFPLATWYQHWNQFALAFPFYSEALKIYRELAIQEKDTYISGVADTLNHLGRLQSRTGRFSEAVASCTEALVINRELATKEPAVYRSRVANTLHNLGNFQCRIDHFLEAEVAYTEALMIRRELAINEPAEYLPNMADTLNNLGLLQCRTECFPEAEASYAKALKIRCEFDSQEPGVYRSRVANTLHNLGLLQCLRERFSEAEVSLTEALRIRQELAAKEPGAYLPSMADTLNSLGILQTRTGRFPDAEASLTEALRIRQEFATKEPGAFQPKVIETLNNLEELQSRMLSKK